MHVEIWSDIACPWCFVGKRRFEAALAQFEHADELEIEWRSFELDPDAPAEREGSMAGHLAAKYGRTIEEAEGMNAQMTETAAGEGLAFRFDLARSGRTFDAHRVIHLAKAQGLQGAMEERLFAAYLEQGELVSDPATLERLAVEVGLDAADVRRVLASDEHADAVREDERTAAQLGISAVPCFVVDRTIAASGAQPPAALLDLLQQGWERRTPMPVVTGGDACGPEGC